MAKPTAAAQLQSHINRLRNFLNFTKASSCFSNWRETSIVWISNKLLTILAGHRANIMTINSTVPSNGSGVVTIASETVNLEVPLEDLLEEFRQVPGVIKADILAG